MVRLGSKPSPSTASMALASQTGYRFGASDWEEIDEMKTSLGYSSWPLNHAFSRFNRQLVPSELLYHLESTHPEYFEALSVPPTDDDMILIGESGRAISHTYLISRWLEGRDPGVLRDHLRVVATKRVWDHSPEERKVLEARWGDEILRAQIDDILEAGDEYNACQEPISYKFKQSSRQVLRSRRVIACTTTGAAIYRDAIQSAEPEIIVVEEAGEVLECHVLAALGKDCKQLILIGDQKSVVIFLRSRGASFTYVKIFYHRQLRPKINSYELTVEKGDGYDLNRSLFERLVMEGHPYRALSKQHRMRPEISALVRHLTYPDLIDDPKTNYRPPIRGLQNTVIFIDHNHPENGDSSLFDPKYVGATTSKSNKFETDMIVEIVKYLKQQNYNSNEITVLTPYLGQLVMLRDALGTHDEVAFGEMDALELEGAGLSDLLAKLLLSSQKKQPLKIATIGGVSRHLK